ncbi:MAG TPA: hypothetical protein VHW23_00435 [Kofleriaceae bacterium]|nr:hypothetical protein [Kofleriaceae bacterium]
MRRDLLSVLTLLAVLAGCSGGGGIGESCGTSSDCAHTLQCLNDICMPRCERAPDCGDGYACHDGLCVLAPHQPGDNCLGESDCPAGQSCQINGAAVDSMNRLISSCVPENPMGHPAGAPCASDIECRNGTCELGHCVDLCRDTTDCARGTSCMTIPRVAVSGELFAGCLPDKGIVSWDIPVASPNAQILLPVPSGAKAAELVMSVDDPGQKVGAESVLDPCGCTRYTVPCTFAPSGPGPCTDLLAADQFYSRDPNATGPIAIGSGPSDVTSNVCGGPLICNDTGGAMVNHVRHIPAFGSSVLLMPSIPSDSEIRYGAYRIQVSSFWPDNSPGSAVPHITAVMQMDLATTLDLHFFFLDLDDHPCSAKTDNAALSATTAQGSVFFRTDYLGELRQIFGQVGIVVNDAGYEDITNRHALDGVDVADIGSLFALRSSDSGINVFFVRSLSPLGTEVFGPTPGPAGVGGTPASGIAVSLDTLCYRDWPAVARLTAHAIGHYMGLYHNVEPRDPVQLPTDPPWQDLVPDTDSSVTNLMYFSQAHAGTVLTVKQTDLLERSPVLR